MSRTDKDRPWEIREAEAPELPWNWILNTQGKQGYKHRERRRWHHAQRHALRVALQNEQDPAPLRGRNSVRSDLV